MHIITILRNYLGFSIAFYRQLRGLTQIQLTDQLGILSHQLCRYEKGEQNPK